MKVIGKSGASPHFSNQVVAKRRKGNRVHLEVSTQGVEVWNDWREKNPGLIPDLEEADLGSGPLQLRLFFKKPVICISLQDGVRSIKLGTWEYREVVQQGPHVLPFEACGPSQHLTQKKIQANIRGLVRAGSR